MVMTRRRKVALSLVFGIALVSGVGFTLRKKSEDARLLALRAAQSVGAEGAEDLLRYSKHCNDAADFWILSTQGADTLWEKQYDSQGHYRLWFRASERAKGFRVMRHLSCGPAPKDDEFHWLIEKIRDRVPTPEQNFSLYIFGGLYNATPEQRNWAEQTLKPLATSPNPTDRIFYATRAEWSDSAIAKETLATLLNDPDPKVVAAAITAIPLRNRKVLEPRMRAFLESSIPPIRQAAWSSASWFRENREIQERVRQGLWSSISSDRESAILSMTYQIPPAPRERTRVRELLNDSNPKVRISAIRALGRWNDAPSFPKMESMTHDADIKARTMAVLMLGTNKVRSILPLAREWLHSQEESERRAGVFAVWKLDDRTSLPELEKLEGDPRLYFILPQVLQEWRPKNKAVDLLQKTFQFPFVQ